MPSPSPHACGRSVLGPTIAIAVGLMLVQCDRPDPPVPEPVQTDAPQPTPPPAADLAPVPAPRLTRRDLIGAAGQAASGYALGAPPAATDPLVGRRFSVRMPFGCSAPAAVGDEGSPGIAHWAWGPERQTIRIQLTPADWTDSALMRGPSPATDTPAWEAVDGFWVPQPWIATESCPTAPSDQGQAGSGPVSPQTLGLAAVFEAGGSRLGRRNGKAYAFTVRPSGDQPLIAPAGGYRLVLEGRLAGFPGGRAIRCRAAGPDQRPVCVAAVQLDKVAFEDAAGSTLSEWRPG